jgi:thiamine kinase-like enzyme
MNPSDLLRAIDAAMSTASSLGLAAENAVVLSDSTKLALRLAPCDVVARVAHAPAGLNPLELALARRLAESGGPVVVPDPRVEPRVYSRGGFLITFWTYHASGTLWDYYEPGAPGTGLSASYARALEQLHAGMRTLALATPHFMDRVDEAQQIVGQHTNRTLLTDADHELVSRTLLHGEPHPGNVLDLRGSLLFIDLETCCRGPVEFDLAHVPDEVSAHYATVDADLLQDCRGLVLAMVAAWRCDPGDQLPNREQVLAANLRGLRQGPPWPTLDALGRSRAEREARRVVDRPAQGEYTLGRRVMGRDPRPRIRVRVGRTVRRTSYSWSPAVLDLLRHLEHESFAGAPRALGFDDQGREVLTYVEGEVGRDDGFIPDQGGRFDKRLPDYVWRDDVLVQLGALLRAFHDAAATFPWAGREWCWEPRQPVETVCHNEVFPGNTVFREGLPVAFIDWDTAVPGPRAWDLGFVACRWVPFWRDAKCRAYGLPIGVAEKARRFRLLVDAYGVEPEIGIVRAGLERMRQFLGQLRELVAQGSEWEVELLRRGVLDEWALEIEWVEEHVAALVGS